MREVGIDISAKKPKLLKSEMINNIDKAVTMGCEQVCPYTEAETIGWELEDPEGKSLEQVRVIRDTIREKVSRMVEEITK
jgi:arsenate reductase (thioredoxin)